MRVKVTIKNIRPIIICKNLNGATIEAFRGKVVVETEASLGLTRNEDQLWNNVAKTTRAVTKEIIGTLLGKVNDYIESRWWDKEI